ncbi:hypothetical protein FA13DRAFT_1568758, partial [Coprinellus micaceus]
AQEELISLYARELFHAQWSVLLDKELVEAMKDGLVLDCPDGNKRCFYPQIFTYSADYPERYVKENPSQQRKLSCHRCLVAKLELDKLGAPNDRE